MELLSLGKIPWQETQLIYHALARLGREALCLVSPAEPYVCVGFHQDVEQDVDLDFCREEGIPVFRRQVGGGAVYLDGDQLFFQLIMRRTNPLIPKQRDAFYRRFLEPVVNVYRRIGIDARYKPVNDVLSGSRKISGTGVGEIGECVVFVGNLIVNFDYQMMSRVLKVPDEKFRDKVNKTLQENLSTIKRELGTETAAQWDESTLNAMLAEEFGRLVGSLNASQRDTELISEMQRVAERMLSKEWLFQKGRRRREREVKIRAGVNVIQRAFKASGGLLRAQFVLQEGCLSDIRLSGDFFCYPQEGIAQLEQLLEGRRTGELLGLLEDFYARGKIETPGVGPADWAALIAP